MRSSERSPVTSQSYAETTIHTHSYGQNSITSHTNLHVFGLQEEAEVPGTDLHKNRENTLLFILLQEYPRHGS